jgi:hypothetical protein
MLVEALEDSRWLQAMDDEYKALMKKTWHLVPPSSTRNIIDCKCVSRKIRMVPYTDIKHV